MIQVNQNYSYEHVCILIVWLVIIACPGGNYGAGCLQNCTCVSEQESSPCDHVDGTCHCLPGYNGSSCELGRLELMTKP